jgi:hypothetical protein
MSSPLKRSDRRALLCVGHERGLHGPKLREGERLNASEEERRKLVAETLRLCEELEREAERRRPSVEDALAHTGELNEEHPPPITSFNMKKETGEVVAVEENPDFVAWTPGWIAGTWTPSASSVVLRTHRPSARAPRSRRLRTARRARSPGRSRSSDDDPDPVRPRRGGALRAFGGAYLWPSRVWVRLGLEAEDRLRRYARGEDV